MGPALIQGASRGLGLQFSRALASRGTTVIACCRDPGGAEGLRSLQSEHPSLIDVVQLDVTSEGAVQAAAQHVQQTHGKALDLLINCSAILSPSGRGETSLRDVSMKALQDTFTVNTFGPLVMAKYFGPLLQAGQGSIGRQAAEARQQHAAVVVNMSARVGSIGDNKLGGWYSYRMSKSALNMATRNLSIELGRGRKKVICVALHPGTVDTALSRPYHKNVPADKLFSPQQSVGYLLNIIDGLGIDNSGKYYGWDGEEIPF
ncbi:C-signal-like [Scylla paramamosain]|uniref:C-signal-like n=1 Tax=Scylla paramamosain TaxID=85552 RepID=UPI00308363B9